MKKHSNAGTKTSQPDPDSSPIRETLRRIERGEDILSLAGGEASFDPPDQLLRLAGQAMVEGRNSYTSTEGIPSLRSAIVAFAQEEWGAGIESIDNVLVSVGGMEAISLAATAIVRPGDRVLIPNPGWGVVESLMRRLGARIDHYPILLSDGFSIEADAIIGRMNRARMVVINTPSNPTGAVMSRDGFVALLEAAERTGAYVLSDECYHNYVYAGEHASALSCGALDRLIVVNSFSKTFAITGWRLGYAVSSSDLIRRMVAIKETISLCSSSISQWAVAEFLPVSTSYRANARRLCRETMERVVKQLQAIPDVRCPKPDGGFYVFPDLSRIEPSAHRLSAQLQDLRVAVIPGDFFGSEGRGRVRIAFATAYESLSAALNRFEDAVKKIARS